ncbi:interferon-regulated resistance GTP-binding [Fusarium beomiforme]|uniref:Interferon-regulated resistance GTP-binding n=1 Tax=Fusarium beomiforme TaxID=44412 RepID=A0A9P5AGP9_9HYPO|nr:interferon-regulated resistance GTP-binding [Fusarium beomiforme]
MDLSLDANILDQLNTTEAKALHEISDSLSACGVGRIVNLPQIIVVGDQSAGKSSVLEAISHVRFPVQGNLCTRFATELIFRRANATRIDVSVRFADNSKAPKRFQRSGFREDDLGDIITEAKECMGFGKAGMEFSKDVLRLEIEGPKMYPLSLVDLPGFYQVETENQSLNGKETVAELVESYMRQKNSIILVVITANINLANHTALQKAKDIDPERRRTIGVITKPDLTRPGYDGEREYVKVAKNQEAAHKLQLGWHVLRNRAEDESSLEARDQIEDAFFQKGAWATIPSENRGIVSLRKKLSHVLYSHIRNSLPGVVQDIEDTLRERQEELERLGKSRSTQEDLRSFLLGISSDFQRLARDGIYGRYNDEFFGGLQDDHRKFRAQLRNFSRAFDHIIRTKGSTQVIVSADDSDAAEDNVPEYLAEFLKRYPYNPPQPKKITAKELGKELEKKAAANQGLEFPGTPNKDLAMQLFKQQAAPWRDIAESHVKLVTTFAKIFVDQVFEHIVGSPGTNRTTEAILSTCVDPFFDEKEKVLQEKVDELLKPYVQGYALPLDLEFYGTLLHMSGKRLEGRVSSVLKEKYPHLYDDKPATAADAGRKIDAKIIAEDISKEEVLGNGEFGTSRVIDMMLAYYEMSLRTFTDNVINLAVESCLVYDIPDILAPTTVDRMSKERLEELAGESNDTVSRRRILEDELEALRKGLAQCRRYRPREVTAFPLPARDPVNKKKSESVEKTSVEPTVAQPVVSGQTSMATTVEANPPAIAPTPEPLKTVEKSIVPAAPAAPAAPVTAEPAPPTVAVQAAPIQASAPAQQANAPPPPQKAVQEAPASQQPAFPASQPQTVHQAVPQTVVASRPQSQAAPATNPVSGIFGSSKSNTTTGFSNMPSSQALGASPSKREPTMTPQPNRSGGLFNNIKAPEKSLFGQVNVSSVPSNPFGGGFGGFGQQASRPPTGGLFGAPPQN